MSLKELDKLEYILFSEKVAKETLLVNKDEESIKETIEPYELTLTHLVLYTMFQLDRCEWH